MMLGLTQRFNRVRHVPLMLTAISTDISLVLYLEVTRHAVEKAASFTLGLLAQTHIALSTVALLLYFPVLYFGWLLLKGRASPRQRILHIRFALAAAAFRSLGFLFMFSMWKS